MEIVGESSDPADAVRTVESWHRTRCCSTSGCAGPAAWTCAPRSWRVQPGCKVVFLTVYDDEQYLYQALRVGAAGFLLKRIRGGELVDYLRRICDGEVLIDPSLAGRVALSAARLRSGEFWPGAHLGLTQRESEVLSLLVAGLSNRAIAMQAGGQRGDGEDPLPRHLPQARRVRPGRRGRGGAARGRLPLIRAAAAWRGADAEREAQLLSRVVETISAGLDLGRILQGVAQLVTETTETDVCFVHLLDEQGRKLRLRGATPPFDTMVGKIELALGEGVSGWVAATASPPSSWTTRRPTPGTATSRRCAARSSPPCCRCRWSPRWVTWSAC